MLLKQKELLGIWLEFHQSASGLDRGKCKKLQASVSSTSRAQDNSSVIPHGYKCAPRKVLDYFRGGEISY
jgi:hypothetical protein